MHKGWMAMNVKKQLLNLKAYAPGKTSDEVKKEYGLTKIVKLASNENPYGCSPNVLKAISVFLALRFILTVPQLI